VVSTLASIKWKTGFNSYLPFKVATCAATQWACLLDSECYTKELPEDGDQSWRAPFGAVGLCRLNQVDP
jgi:hypothetical protein